MKIDSLVRTTSKSLASHTSKTWDEWIALLNSRGAQLLSRKEIVHYLRTKHRLGPWWQQIIATGYEQAIGRRIEGQNNKGLYTVTGTRTISLSSKKAWALLTSDEGVEAWLSPLSPLLLKAGEKFETSGFDGDGAFGEIRVVTKGKQIRFRWQDPEWEKPSTCVLAIHPRAGEKCMISLSHGDLPSARVKETARSHWKTVLDRLNAQVPTKPAKVRK